MLHVLAFRGDIYYVSSSSSFKVRGDIFCFSAFWSFWVILESGLCSSFYESEAVRCHVNRLHKTWMVVAYT